MTTTVPKQPNKVYINSTFSHTPEGQNRNSMGGHGISPIPMRNSASPMTTALKPRASVKLAESTTPEEPAADSYLQILQTESMMATCLKEDTRANFKIMKMIEKRKKLQEEIYKMKLEVQKV